MIREAKLHDIPEILKLLEILFTQEADFNPDKKKQIAGLSAVLQNPGLGTILLAEQENVIVGSIHVALVHSTVEGGKVANIEDFIVHPDYRGSGLGKELMEAAVIYVQSKDIHRITLLTDSDNKTAQRFYERNGFEKSKMIPLRRYL